MVRRSRRRRRTDLVQVFPNPPALERLTTAVLCKMHDEWIVFSQYAWHRLQRPGVRDVVFAKSSCAVATSSRGAEGGGA